LTLVAALVACTSIDCPVENLVYTNYELRKADGTADALNTDTVWIWTKRADGTDTLLVNGLCGSSANSFTLQISYTDPEDVFILYLRTQEENSYLDTFRIKKENYPHFESVDCQASFFHELKSVRHTTNAIDSIIIKNTTVDYDTKTVHFYLYPKSDD
jgi:hypothetical protein